MRLHRLLFFLAGAASLAPAFAFLWFGSFILDAEILPQWLAGRVSLEGRYRALNLWFSGNGMYLLPLAYLLLAGIWLWLGARLMRVAATGTGAAATQRGWWLLKQALEFALVLWVIVQSLRGFDTGPALPVPDALARSVALLGGALTLWHYLLIKRAGRGRLARSGGLFRWLRHPMYLGELLLFGGLALMTGEVVALSLFALACAVLLALLPAEEATLAERHPEAWATWSRHTGRLLPRLVGTAGEADE